MRDKKSLTVNDLVFGKFNGLKLRIAIAQGNRVPPVIDLVSALIIVGERHYDEVVTELAKAEG